MTKARTNADNVTADIAGITAGTGITGGGTSGTVTITNDMATTIAAKGDILAGTANDAYSALTVGSNDTVLTADSSTATGLKWATPAAGATLLRQSVSANYYRASVSSSVQNNSIDYYQATYYVPVYLPTGTVDRITIRTGSAFSGTSTVRLGIYNNSNGLPTTVLLDAGTISATAASTTYSITVSTAVTAGWYWLVSNHTDSGGLNNYAVYDFSSTTTITNGFISSFSSTNPLVKLPVAYYQTGVTGAFATAGTLLSMDNYCPITSVRVS